MNTASQTTPLESASSGFETVEGLVQFIRNTVPDADSISDLQTRPDIGAVMFRWHGTGFFVTQALDVYEVRDRYMYVTTVSTLLRTVLARRRKKESMLESTVKTLKDAEELFWAKNQPRAAVMLIETVKENLGRQVHDYRKAAQAVG